MLTEAETNFIRQIVKQELNKSYDEECDRKQNDCNTGDYKDYVNESQLKINTEEYNYEEEPTLYINKHWKEQDTPKIIRIIEEQEKQIAQLSLELHCLANQIGYILRDDNGEEDEKMPKEIMEHQSIVVKMIMKNNIKLNEIKKIITSIKDRVDD